MAIQTIPANAPCIQYFGRWNTPGERRFTVSRYSTAYFSFRGSTVSVALITGPGRGEAVISLDGAREAVINLNAPVEGKKTFFEKKISQEKWYTTFPSRPFPRKTPLRKARLK